MILVTLNSWLKGFVQNANSPMSGVENIALWSMEVQDKRMKNNNFNRASSGTFIEARLVTNQCAWHKTLLTQDFLHFGSLRKQLVQLLCINFEGWMLVHRCIIGMALKLLHRQAVGCSDALNLFLPA